MLRAKNIFLISAFVISFVLISSPDVFPETFQFQDILAEAEKSDILIIFNPGGWGDTSYEKAKDLSPIIEEMKGAIKGWGYESVVVPYIRSRDDILGRISEIKEMFRSFNNSSADLAKKIEYVAEKMPDKKIVLTGLSNGAAFVNETYKKISDKAKESIYCIVLGPPFWASNASGSNVLVLDNKGKDSLAKGDIKTLLSDAFRGPFKWLSSLISGKELALSEAFTASGHIYSWPSPDVGPEIVSFLEQKLK